MTLDTRSPDGIEIVVVVVFVVGVRIKMFRWMRNWKKGKRWWTRRGFKRDSLMRYAWHWLVGWATTTTGLYPTTSSTRGCVCVSWWGRCGATMAPPCCYPPVGGRSLQDVETPPIDGGKLVGHWAKRVTSRTSFWLAIGPEIRPRPFSRFSRNFRSGEMTNRRCREEKRKKSVGAGVDAIVTLHPVRISESSISSPQYF